MGFMGTLMTVVTLPAPTLCHSGSSKLSDLDLHPGCGHRGSEKGSGLLETTQHLVVAVMALLSSEFLGLCPQERGVARSREWPATFPWRDG